MGCIFSTSKAASSTTALVVSNERTSLSLLKEETLKTNWVVAKELKLFETKYDELKTTVKSSDDKKYLVKKFIEDTNSLAINNISHCAIDLYVLETVSNALVVDYYLRLDSKRFPVSVVEIVAQYSNAIMESDLLQMEDAIKVQREWDEYSIERKTFPISLTLDDTIEHFKAFYEFEEKSEAVSKLCDDVTLAVTKFGEEYQELSQLCNNVNVDNVNIDKQLSVIWK